VFFQIFTNGLCLGAIFALIAIGYSMVYGIMRLMNFAHGDTYMFGTFVCYVLLTKFHFGMVLSIITAMIVGAMLAMVVERVAYRPLRAQSRSISMITALGAAYIIQNCEELLFGVEVYRFPSVISSQIVSIYGLEIPVPQAATLVISVSLLICFNIFLKYHKVGKAVLCMAQDIPIASLMGIPVDKTISIIYALGGLLGVAGGVLYASSYNVIYIGMGFSGTIFAFTAAIIGGIGSLNGAVLGGFILGILQSLVGTYLPTAYRDVISFLFLILILLIKPTGLLPMWETGEKV